MTVSLLEIIAAARARLAPLAAESAGYLVLGVADHVASAPRVTGPEWVELSSDGLVRLARGEASEAPEGGPSPERSLRRLLAQTLEVSSSVGPALRRAAERADDVGLATLVRELETALIPVNRAAARRALSRLYRETARVRDAGKLELLLLAPAAAYAELPAPPAAADLPTEVLLTQEVSVVPAAALPVVAAVVEPVPTAAVAPAAAASRAVDETLTNPEPVVARARQRGQSTPTLGTVTAAQGGETDAARTWRAPPVDFDPEPELRPEPSCLPDVLSAMLELHTGVAADEALTRLRDVVTETGEAAPVPVGPAPESDSSSDDEWMVVSSLSGVESEVVASEAANAAVHDALTWAPAPVAPRVQARVATVATPGLPPRALGLPPPEASRPPQVPLPTRQSDVTELLQSFHVSGAAEEHELRGALKEMAGLELTPMPLAYVDEG